MNLVKINSINLWDEEWELGYWDKDNGQAVSSSSWKRNKNPIKCEPNTSYYCLASATSGSWGYFVFYDSSMNWVGNNGSGYNVSFTTPNNAHYMNFYARNAYFDNPIQICLNSCADKTTYHPHWVLGLDGQGKAIAPDISQMLPSNMTVVDMGTLNWRYSTTNRFYCTISDMLAPINNTYPPNAICTTYNGVEQARFNSDVHDKRFFVTPSGNMYVQDTDYTDYQSFKQGNAGVLLFYKKATT